MGRNRIEVAAQHTPVKGEPNGNRQGGTPGHAAVAPEKMPLRCRVLPFGQGSLHGRRVDAPSGFVPQSPQREVKPADQAQLPDDPQAEATDGTVRRGKSRRAVRTTAAAALLLALSGCAGAISSGPPPPKTIEVVCHVSAGSSGHSTDRDKPLGDQGWQTFKNKSKETVNVVFTSPKVDIQDENDSALGLHHLRSYQEEVANIPPHWRARLDWIVDQAGTNRTRGHMTCSQVG